MKLVLRPVLLAMFSALLIVQVAVCILGAKLGSDGRGDFRHLYTAGYMVRSGHRAELYDYDVAVAFQNKVVGQGIALPFDHMAYESLLFVPFSYLKYATAYFIFFAVNLLLLALSARIARPQLEALAGMGAWAAYGPFFCFLPMAVALVLGQDSIILLALCVAAFESLHRGKDFRAGVFLALGLFKFQFVVPIALLFLLWKKWRVVGGVIAGGIVVSIVSLLIVGFGAVRQFAHMLIDMSVGLTNQSQRVKYETFPARMPNLRGLMETVAGSHVPHGVVQGAVIAASLAVIVIAARMRPSLATAIVAAELVSYHGLIHDASILAIPLAMTFDWMVLRSSAKTAAIACLVFVTPALLFRGQEYFLMAIPVACLFFVMPRAAAAEARV